MFVCSCLQSRDGVYVHICSFVCKFSCVSVCLRLVLFVWARDVRPNVTRAADSVPGRYYAEIRDYKMMCSISLHHYGSTFTPHKRKIMLL